MDSYPQPGMQRGRASIASMGGFNSDRTLRTRSGEGAPAYSATGRRNARERAASRNQETKTVANPLTKFFHPGRAWCTILPVTAIAPNHAGGAPSDGSECPNGTSVLVGHGRGFLLAVQDPVAALQLTFDFMPDILQALDLARSAISSIQPPPTEPRLLLRT